MLEREHMRALLPDLPPRDEVSEEYWYVSTSLLSQSIDDFRYKYSKNVEEEERRIKSNQVGKHAGGANN